MVSLVERFSRTLLLILLLSRVPKVTVQTNYEGSRNPRNPYEHADGTVSNADPTDPPVNRPTPYTSLPGAHRCWKLRSRVSIPTRTQLSWGLFLLICGDVHCNAGPGPKYQCSECDKVVRFNQHGLYCEVCFSWAHRVCVDMNEAEYFHWGQIDDGCMGLSPMYQTSIALSQCLSIN